MPKRIERSPFEPPATEMPENSSGKPTNKKPRGRRPSSAEDWRPYYIGALMEGASIRKAAAVANVHLTTALARRRTDEEFKRAWKEAVEIGTELLEQEAQRRAYHGVIEPIFQKGVKVGCVRRYSDTLLMFILKKRDPAYRDGGNLTINTDVKVLNVFDDIDRDIKLLTMDAAPAGSIPADGDAQPLDAPQSTRAQAAPEAD